MNITEIKKELTDIEKKINSLIYMYGNSQNIEEDIEWLYEFRRKFSKKYFGALVNDLSEQEIKNLFLYVYFLAMTIKGFIIKFHKTEEQEQIMYCYKRIKFSINYILKLLDKYSEK
jgi:hypothetical protein